MLCTAAVCLVVLGWSVSAAAQECGDVTDDGGVFASDALAVLKKAVGQDVELICTDGCALLEPRLEALETLLASLSIDGDNLVLTAMNLQVVSGSGDTDGTVNGLGNVIVGYDEANTGDSKDGSHNLVVGAFHDYPSYGGLVAGQNNSVSGEASSVTGGRLNIAEGDLSTINGGLLNQARGLTSSIAGGEDNLTNSTSAVVSGGTGNTADGETAAVSGGEDNEAAGASSVVSGGRGRTATSSFDWHAGGLFQGE